MKILYAILANHKNLDRLNNVLSSWVRNINEDGYVIIGNEKLSNYKNNIIAINSELESYNNLSIKMSNFYNEIIKKDWDFIIKIDDDAFVIPSKMKTFLSQFDYTKDFYIGLSLNGYYSKLPSLDFASGGAGYVITKSALTKIVPIFPDQSIIEEDVHIGNCLNKQNIKLTHTKLFDGFGDPIDAIIYKGKITCHYVKHNQYKPLQRLSEQLRIEPFDIIDYNVSWGDIGLCGYLGYEDNDIKISKNKIFNAISAHAPSEIIIHTNRQKLELHGAINDTGFGTCRFIIKDSSNQLLCDLGVAGSRQTRPEVINTPKDGILRLICESTNDCKMPISGGHSIWIWNDEKHITWQQINKSQLQLLIDTIDIDACKLVASGLGDAIMCLPILFGLIKKHKDKKIRFIANNHTIKWIKMFYENVVTEDKIESVGEVEYKSRTNRHNSNNIIEQLSKSCNVEPFTEKLRPKISEKVKNWANQLTNNKLTISIAPFTACGLSDTDRNYPHWFEVYNILKNYYNVIILDKTDERNKIYPSIISDLEQTIAILENSTIYLGNDSGLSHLAGVIGIPSLIVCGEQIDYKHRQKCDGETAFEWYKLTKTIRDKNKWSVTPELIIEQTILYIKELFPISNI